VYILPGITASVDPDSAETFEDCTPEFPEEEPSAKALAFVVQFVLIERTGVAGSGVNGNRLKLTYIVEKLSVA
jgi:hypothetical protein